jgi:hypothetical protein
MASDTRRVRPTPQPVPAVISRARVVIRLHTRPTRQARWRPAGEFGTREEAWDVIAKLPSGTHLWLNDVIAGAAASTARC